ncbi:MAG: GDSL-type esterase/lipase family protein [Elainellaceae cyanobacterium]
MSDLCLLAALAASQAKQQAQQMSAALAPPSTAAVASEHDCDAEGRSAIALQQLSKNASQGSIRWVAVERQDPEFSSSPIADGRSPLPSLASEQPVLASEQAVPAAAEPLQYPLRPHTTPSVPESETESEEHDVSLNPSVQVNQTRSSLRDDRAPQLSLPAISEPSLRVPTLPENAGVVHGSPSPAISPPLSIDVLPEASDAVLGAASGATSGVTSGAASVPLPSAVPSSTDENHSPKPLAASEVAAGEVAAGMLPIAADANTQNASDRPNILPVSHELTAVLPQEIDSPMDSSEERSPLLARIAVPQTKAVRPASGSQFFRQRWVALRAGRSYTRLDTDSFAQQWRNATYQPSHEDWVQLLAQEANAMARGQGNNRLTVLLGDSISLWFPSDYMARYRFWLNQSISGDTAAGTIRRLSLFSRTRPDTIHVMLGINDLRRGVSDAQLLNDQRYIMRRLRQQHPQAQIVVHSILPTRLHYLPSDRIQPINRQLEAIAQQEGVQFLDLQPYFADSQGNLRADLTTDGLHLNPQGYATWYRVLAHFRLV